MPRTTLPTNDLLSLVGAGAAARAPNSDQAPKRDAGKEHRSSARSVAARRIAPKRKKDAHAGVPADEKRTAGAGQKEKFNCRIVPDLADSIRNCVVALSGPPHRLTIDNFAEEAFRREVSRLERLHHGGRAFDERPYNPRPGRPVR